MRRRSLIVFVILNVFISLAVAYGVITLLNPQGQQNTTQVVITVPILVTATTDPNFTPEVRIITATPLPGSIGLLPTGILETAASPSTPLATIDAAAISGALSGDTALQTTATNLPQNCILHVIADGDTPFGIAEQYGISGFDLMEVNGLTEETAGQLQIGQVLIVPLEGCPLTAADLATEAPTSEAEETIEVTDEASSSVTPTATVRPTLTLPPTATNAQVEIVEVTGIGQINSEGIIIRNVGNNINMNGWTLSDADGNTYTFAERVLFSNGLISIFSRVGQDTAIALFWNRTSAVFAPGDVLTLKDDDGVVQSTYRVQSPVNLP